MLQCKKLKSIKYIINEFFSFEQERQIRDFFEFKKLSSGTLKKLTIYTLTILSIM